jgi:hypothetical protein
MSGVVFIDGDLIIHKVGAIGQDTSVLAVIDDIPRGEFKNRTEAREFLSEAGIEYTKEEYEIIVSPKPWAHVLYALNGMINNIVAGSGCSKYQLYVEGDVNFRKSLATIKPYKASPSRLASAKPHYFHRIKQYLIDEYAAVVTKDIETDDYISIATSLGYYKGRHWVGATVDKDANQTEGWLYNWDKMDSPKLITPIEGARSLWKQMLTGDTVDNIQGCRGVGAKSPAMTALEDSETEFDMYGIVRHYYTQAADKHGLVLNCNEKELSVLDEMRENLALLYMFRTKPRYDNDKMILESEIKLNELEAQYATAGTSIDTNIRRNKKTMG